MGQQRFSNGNDNRTASIMKRTGIRQASGKSNLPALIGQAAATMHGADQQRRLAMAPGHATARFPI
jgi:hypothetical protein